jgi:hypothetical protein
MNVDAEIYIKQLIGFFDKNPEELKTLIGLMSKENFYQKIRDKVYSKVETKVENYILTKKEMGELIYQLHEETHGKAEEIIQHQSELTLEGIFMKSKFGYFSMN